MPPDTNEAGVDARLQVALLRVSDMGDDIAEIKQSMQKMAEAVTRLAVIEERQSHDRQEISRLFKRQDGHEVRIGALEAAQPQQKKTSEWVDKAVWLVLSAVAAAVLSTVIVSRTASHTTAPAAVAPTR